MTITNYQIQSIFLYKKSRKFVQLTIVTLFLNTQLHFQTSQGTVVLETGISFKVLVIWGKQ